MFMEQNRLISVIYTQQRKGEDVICRDSGVLTWMTGGMLGHFSLCLSFCLCISVSVSLYQSVSLSLSIFLSVSLSHTPQPRKLNWPEHRQRKLKGNGQFIVRCANLRYFGISRKKTLADIFEHRWLGLRKKDYTQR